jgi:CRISPR system Cascade subunit CasE
MAVLYASVLHLDRKAVKRLRITDPYSLHRVIYSLFEDIRSVQEKQAAASSGIVYADQGGDFTGRKVLILSDRLPAAQLEGNLGRLETKEIPSVFLAASRYRFKTIVNPTYRDSTTRKLVPVKGREAVSGWFCERAEESWGFQVHRESLQVDRIEVLRFTDKRQRQITMAQASLHGLLEVTDRERFTSSFSRGIGRGRAFGCGLLQIVPHSL